MFFIYFLAFFAFIPISAYLLSQNTNNKGSIFGISFLVIIVCLFTVVGKYSFLGSIQKQKINSEILMNISADKKISEINKKNFSKNINNEDKVFWLQNYINKAIEDSKFIAAESLISTSEQYFQTTDQKFIFYTLYTKLRDAKFPDFAKSKLIINFAPPPACSAFFGTAEVFIMNGPNIPLASKKFVDTSEFIFENIDSSIPGFDLASAYLNQESLDLKVSLNCLEIDSIYNSENALLIDNNQPVNSYNIEANEWFKREQ